MESVDRDHTIALPDGRTLGYAQYGDGEGKPLLYFHGGVSSRLDIAFAHQYCQERAVKIIAPDRPGIGISSLSRHRTMLDWASDVQCLLNQLSIDRLPLLAWSLGGSYAYACAYKIPERFSKIATVGGASPLISPVSLNDLGMWTDRFLLCCPPYLQWLLALIVSLGGKLPPAMVKKILLSEVSSCDRAIIAPMTDYEASHFIIESTSQGGWGVVDDYNAYANDWQFAVENIISDITLWQGADDSLCPRAMTDYLAERIQNATLKIVPEQGHFLLHRHLSQVLDDLM